MYRLVEYDEDRASVAHYVDEVEPFEEESPEEIVWGEEMAEIEAMYANWVDAEDEIEEVGVHEVFMVLMAAVIAFALFLLAA